MEGAIDDGTFVEFRMMEVLVSRFECLNSLVLVSLGLVHAVDHLSSAEGLLH